MSIVVKNLFYNYALNTPRGESALQDVSFQVHDGEFVGIMGHTGCGKSTLVQLLAGLLTPSGGQIFIDGADINASRYDRAVLRQTVGIVFQYPEYQLFETTVEKDVAFALKHSGLGKAEKEARVRWALEMMGFSYEDIRKKSPLSLSGGEKRRVAIAGVLAAKPKILIFDEPIAGLDPFGRAEFLGLIARLHQQGSTILMVSHNIDAICEYAKRILVLNGGKLVADGEPEQIFHNPDLAEQMHIGVGNVRSIAQRLYEKGVIQTPVITKQKALVEAIKAAQKAGDA